MDNDKMDFGTLLSIAQKNSNSKQVSFIHMIIYNET